jgi:hypothetical protein
VVPLTIGLIALVIVLVLVGARLSRRAAARPTPRPSRADRPARSEPIAKRVTSQLTPPRPARPGGYDWDRRTHQLYRA